MNYVSKNVFTHVDMSNILTGKREIHLMRFFAVRGVSPRYKKPSVSLRGAGVKMGFNIPPEYSLG